MSLINNCNKLLALLFLGLRWTCEAGSRRPSPRAGDPIYIYIYIYI